MVQLEGGNGKAPNEDEAPVPPELTDDHGIGVLLLPEIERLLAGEGDHGPCIQPHLERLQALADRLRQDQLSLLTWHCLVLFEDTPPDTLSRSGCSSNMAFPPDLPHERGSARLSLP